MSSTVIPGLRYRDAHAAIDWLTQVFGFKANLIVPGENNTVRHSQLALGTGMIMLSSITDSPASQLLTQPDEINNKETQAPCLVVDNADEIYKRVQATDAKILMPIEDFPFGGRGFCCADPEGHIWHVGTYNPWTAGH